ncbi:hypothetical protein PIB30_047155 [Stylosanthes scabra]|uniref:Uncharacterized protein n=1 Tax=Stylosanthes scabra TaxID=79078 RepID=A0ABU6XGW4_9FABA|nr:hypothetical protein [Stylosanthes scabra]
MASNTFFPTRKHRNFRRGILLSNNNKQSGYTNSPVNLGRGFPNNDDVTARKLAAAFWQLRSSYAVASSNIPELLSPMQHLKRSKEDATKWDPAIPRPFNLQDTELLVGDRDSIVTILVEELHQAQRSIAKLKAAHKSSKKRVEQFLENMEEEKLSWKHKLARETRRMRMESIDVKLAHKLAEANLSAKKFMLRYEKEKKERELIEQVCNELATQIGAKNEGLMSDSSKIYKKMILEEKYNDDDEKVHLSHKQIASFDHKNKNYVLDKPNRPSSDHNSAFKTSVSCSTRNCDDLNKREGGGRVSGEGKSIVVSSMKKNPHVTREIKGCVEWPRGIPKASTSKVIPLEERIRTQKSQIQNILRSKR